MATAEVFHDSSPGSLPTSSIHFCILCGKPFSTGSTRDRHVRYCGHRLRTRPRSCQACNKAKSKCSFDTPCSRCLKKGIQCRYIELHSIDKRRSDETPAASTRTIETPMIGSSSLFTPDVVDQVQGNAWTMKTFGNAENLEDTEISGARLQHCEDGGGPLNELLSGGTFSKDILSLDIPILLPDDPMNLIHGDPGVLSAAYSELSQPKPSWCSWARAGLSLSVVDIKPSIKASSNDLLHLQHARPHFLHNANIIIQSLRSLPMMMIRRETFPWFIHPQSQLLSDLSAAALPESISTCMSITQMFASRTSDTRKFLWTTIKSECRRFTLELQYMSKFDLLAAIQACMIYIIMYIIDQPSEATDGSELLLPLHDLYILFKEACGRPCGGPSSQDQLLNPTTSWIEWMFAESQRRLTLLWFLMGIVVCVKNGIACDDATQSYRALPLPGPKSLWEAPSQSVWETEYQANQMLQIGGPVSLGDLIDLQQSPSAPANEQKLDRWNANIDNLGSLLNLVSTMI